MNGRSIRATLLALFFIACHSAAGATIDADWDAGKQAFGAGDYESALMYFERARAGGLDSPAVHYNIAVTQYKLRRYRAADASFESIGRRFPQMRGIAEYNLGLTAARLGNDADARAHFRRAYELSAGDAKLRALAQAQLGGPEPEVSTASHWSGAFGVRAGNDDNVALLDETGLATGTTTDSPLAEVFATVAGPFRGRNGFRVEGSAYFLRYFDAGDFDQSEILGAAYYEWRPANWRLQLGAQVSTGTIGGTSYDRKLGPRMRVVRYLGPNASIDLRYHYDDVSEADSVYAGLAGTRRTFDLRYRWYRDGHRLQFGYLAEMNDRDDAGVSPDRRRFGVDYRYQPARGPGFEAGISLRESDYDALVTPREEDLTMLRGALTYLLRNDWLVLLEYRNYDNDSTDPVYDYDRGQISIGALTYF